MTVATPVGVLSWKTPTLSFLLQTALSFSYNPFQGHLIDPQAEVFLPCIVLPWNFLHFFIIELIHGIETVQVQTCPAKL